MSAQAAGLRIELPVEGMHCAGCATRLTKTLASVEGVEAANVVFATGRASIDGQVLTRALIEAVRSAGFEVSTLTWRARSPHARALADALTAAPLPGVVEAAAESDALRVTVAAGVCRRRDLSTWAANRGERLAWAPEGDADDPVAAEQRLALRRDHGLRARFFGTLPCSLAVMALAMHGSDSTTTRWLQFALTLPVLAFAGAPFFVEAAHAARRWAADMSTLVSIGTLAAFAWSVFATLGPVEAAAVYFESTTSILSFVLLGRWLEGRARRRAGDATTALLSLAPPHATRVDTSTGDEAVVPLEAVEPGDTLRLKVGEAVPVDGIVLSGRVTLDESLLTGEPLPVDRDVGGAVLSGTRVSQGTALIEARRTGRETVLARIVASMRHAQSARAPIQRLVDRVSSVFVPVVIALAAVTFVAWWWGAGRLDAAVEHAVAVLIVACPCALGLATPVTLVVSTGAAARAGFLARDLGALERAHRVDTLVFDKTGTLTQGRPTLEHLECAAGTDPDALLSAIAAVERGSTHPLARAIGQYASARGVDDAHADAFQETLGAGVEGRVGGHTVRVGTRAFIGLDDDAFGDAQAEAAARGATTLFARHAELGDALLVFSDPVRPEASHALDGLRRDGFRLVLLSGDATAAAQALGRSLGFAEGDVWARVSPGGKADRLAALRAQGARVAMVGDGANDAPALAAADLGVAMGEGAAAALEAADFVLLVPDLSRLSALFALSHRTLKVLRQNLAWAFGYNLLALPLASGALLGLGLPALSPALASALMALSSVSVTLNALRVGRRAGSTGEPSPSSARPDLPHRGH